VCCRASSPKSPDAASVESLGVRPAWRGRGVGRALLLAAFGELQRRGIPAVELGVDLENQTGATRLYEQVGMRAVRRAERWEKELRR
jgi:mycothiol synthase